jgi:trans-aconitate 2-methyltransferase
VSLPSWDPEQYQRFAAERARPFHDLVAQVPTASPSLVVDLGCGPGTVTATLATRWPDAIVRGLDSSPAMIAAAGRLALPGRLEFALGDVVDWRPEPASVDVIVANALLQWVPDHLGLLPGWVAALRPGGSLAFQVPATGDSPADRVFRTVAGSARWAARLAAASGGRTPRGAGSPVRESWEYADALARLGLRTNVWETTYLHLLTGADPVLEWFAGTGLRPYLDALADDPHARAAFREEVASGLREAYPPRPYGTILPFRRIFAVASR